MKDLMGTGMVSRCSMQECTDARCVLGHKSRQGCYHMPRAPTALCCIAVDCCSLACTVTVVSILIHDQPNDIAKQSHCIPAYRPQHRLAAQEACWTCSASDTSMRLTGSSGIVLSLIIGHSGPKLLTVSWQLLLQSCCCAAHST
jgi:hypothetical protein